MKYCHSTIAILFVLGSVCVSGAAHAQRADQNAVTGSDDAFGATVGLETVGIYADTDTRGFSPLDAGNARIDGIYYDPVGRLVIPLKETTTIRVGTAAKGFPFLAPTGIADYQLKPFPDEYGHTVGGRVGPYGGYIGNWFLRLPVLEDKLGVVGGFAVADVRSGDGSYNKSLGSAIRPIFRFGDVEFAPFYARADFFKDYAHPLIIPVGTDLPDLPKKRRYLGQDWAKGLWHDEWLGATFKAKITDAVSIRAGLFRAAERRKKNYSDIFYITGPDNDAQHQLIADPSREKRSTSGEAIVGLKLGNTKWEHRLFAGFRARERVTETGGSQTFDFGPVKYGALDPQPEPEFNFSAISIGRLRQSAFMLGYIAELQDVGQINLGVQKARYRAQFRDGLTGLADKSRANPWLYNATITINLAPRLSAYAGSERGLEDRGVAPDSASNRSEQLPATLAKQYEGGLRWKFNEGQFVVNAFQITKPYFSYDALNRFVELGRERHRGVEASLSGRFGRLSLLAGAIAMKREVSGAAVDTGIIGKLPSGTPGLRGRIDVNYETDIFGGLTPMVTVIYQGRRAVGSRPQEALGGKQLSLPGFATLDLGLRQQFKIGGVSANVRGVVENVFNKAAWTVAAADTLFPDERRRFTLSLTTDF